MSDTATVARMLALVDEYNLSGRTFVHSYTAEELAADYNGIGPEWFPEKLRKAIDELNEDLQPMAFVHDVRWSHSDGTKAYFTATNNELKRNGCTIAKSLYGWWDPRRYLRMNRAHIFGNLCEAFGYSAYQEAYNKQMKGKNT